MKLNEKQLYELRMELLRMSGGNVEAARAAYDFLMEPAPEAKPKAVENQEVTG